MKSGAVHKPTKNGGEKIVAIVARDLRSCARDQHVRFQPLYAFYFF
jgi:hypothetical protein